MSQNQSNWDPAQYERFKQERAAPFYDLLAGIERRACMRVVDLGCGTGELTQKLHLALQAQTTVGIDNAITMLDRSKPFLCPGLRFVRQDIEAFAERDAYDLVFSNAALHWVQDHEALLRRLVGALRAGGRLAVQVPANHQHSSHTIAAKLAREAPFVESLGGYVGHRNVLAPERYAELLCLMGLRRPLVRLQVYVHVLGSVDDLWQWMRGTTLTGFARRLSASLFQRFVDTYRERLHAELGSQNPFRYTFNRIFMWAER